MKDNYSVTAVVLDRSGSMNMIREATIAGYNDFVRTQKEVPGPADLMLVQFDDQYEPNYDLPLDKVPDLTADTYVPRGSTALRDAIGRTIVAVGAKLAAMPEADRPGRVTIVIITDGFENASKEYHADKIAEMIKHQQDSYKWQFVYLGANQDAILVAQHMNINSTHAMSYGANYAGTRSTFMAASMGNNRYKSTGKDVAFLQAERLAAMGTPDAKDKDRKKQPVEETK